MTTFCKYDLAFTTLTKEYKNFLALFSDLLSDVLSPSVTDSYIADLFLRTVEALCLWDAMLPDSEQYYCVHELLDVVNGLSMFGPARGWWALAGERFMSKIKQFCPQGGTNYLKVVYDRFVAYESSIRHNFIPNSVDDADMFDNINGDFTNWKIRLLGSHKVYAWNPYLANKFYDYLADFTCLWEIEVLSRMELFSSFYRLYKTYKNSTHIHRESSFVEWIVKIVDSDIKSVKVVGTEEMKARSLVLEKFHLLKVDLEVGGFSEQNFTTLRQLGRTNTILICDFKTVMQIYDFQPVCYKTATIKGLKFKARGAHACETEPPTLLGDYKDDKDKLRIPSNPLNDLKKHWFDSATTFSKVRNYKSAIAGVIPSEEVYVQNDAFFCLCLPNDSFLHNTKFAMVTARHTQHYIVTDAIKLPYIIVNTTDPIEIESSAERHQDGVIDHGATKSILAEAEQAVKDGDDSDSSGGSGSEDSGGDASLPDLRRSKRQRRSAAAPESIVSSIPVKSSYNESVKFMSLNFYESTNVAICGTDVAHRPVFVKTLLKNLTNEEILEAQSRCCTDFKQTENLFLIDLHSNRGDVVVSLKNSKL